MTTGVLPVDDSLPFTVDTWTAATCTKPQFLSHAHKDHCENIEKWARRVYCTQVTRDLLLLKFPKLAGSAVFHILVVNDTIYVSQDDDPEYSFEVTTLDANHCAGSAVYIFNGWFGTVVHTGDSRLTPEVVHNISSFAAPGTIDLLYLDCTFGRAYLVCCQLPRSPHSSTCGPCAHLPTQHVATRIGWHMAYPPHSPSHLSSPSCAHCLYGSRLTDSCTALQASA
jgi:hypothetical protein